MYNISQDAKSRSKSHTHRVIISKAMIECMSSDEMVDRMFTVDIDGTLTENGEGVVNLEALSMLRSLAHSGNRVVYVTGRSSAEAFALSVFGGTGKVAVGENGGCIMTGPTDHILLGDITVCRKAQAILAENIEDVRDKPVFPRMTEVVLERTFDITQGVEIIQQKAPYVSLTDSGYAFHISAQGVDKGRGVRELSQMFGIPKESIIAIGDSSTDIPMFQNAGISVALGNADDTVRAQATMCVKSSRGDGVIEALQTLMPEIS